MQEDVVPRKEKRQYKKRKHKTDSRMSGMEEMSVRSGNGSSGSRGNRTGGALGSGLDPMASSDEDNNILSHSHSQPFITTDSREEDESIEEGPFAFRRNRNCSYLPVSRTLPCTIL